MCNSNLTLGQPDVTLGNGSGHSHRQIAAADEKIALRRQEIDAFRAILSVRERDGLDTSIGPAELRRREAALELYMEHRQRLAAELK
jgi:hypothetical protein